MDSQKPPKSRSRLAPEPDFTVGSFPAHDDVREIADRSEGTPERADGAPLLQIHGLPDACPARVIVTDVHMSFWSMVTLLVKLAFAIIPAAIIITMLVLASIAVAERLIRIVS